MASLELVTPPVALPIAIGETKLWGRITHTEEDSVVQSAISQAVSLIEQALGRSLITQTWKQTLDHTPKEWAWPIGHDQVLRLRKPPLIGDVSIDYVSSVDGSTVTLDPSLYDVFPSKSQKGEISRKLEALAIPLKCGPNVISVTYVAGYGDTAEDVPEPIRNAIKTLSATIFETRGAFADPDLAFRIVTTMCPGYRVLEII